MIAVDATPSQVLLRWLMDHDAVTCMPIVGARAVDQFEENLRAVELSLGAEQFERLTAATT